MREITCVVFGDPGVGKTSLCTRFKANAFSDIRLCNAFEVYNSQLCIDGQEISLVLWDLQTIKAMDSSACSNPEVVILLYAVDSVSSFDNIQHVWYPEIPQHLPDVPIVLVGTKFEMRMGDRAGNCVPANMVERLKNEINIYAYDECSALRNFGVQTVFRIAASAALSLAQSESSQCQLKVPVSRSWVQNGHDLNIFTDAQRCSAPSKVLSTKQSALEYVDKYRASGHQVYSFPPWVESWRDEMVYGEAVMLRARPQVLGSRSGAYQYIRRVRSYGYYGFRAYSAPPAWVEDDDDCDLFVAARNKGAATSVLNSRKTTQDFLIKKATTTSTWGWLSSFVFSSPTNVNLSHHAGTDTEL